MKANITSNKPIKSSFLSYEKDIEEILKQLFINNQPHSDILKKLLVINTKDCLDNTTSEVIKDTIENTNLITLKRDGYIRLEPRLNMIGHQEIKAYIIISIDNFTTNGTNPYYRDCMVNFDIVCHTDYWDLGNYRIRPLKIVGYIDGILNNAKLSGIGTFNFLGCSQLILNEDLAGYTLSYMAVHGNDDVIPPGE